MNRSIATFRQTSVTVLVVLTCFMTTAGPTIHDSNDGLLKEQDNRFAWDEMRFARLYIEPSRIPRRVAFITSRQPRRSGMYDTAIEVFRFKWKGPET